MLRIVDRDGPFVGGKALSDQPQCGSGFRPAGEHDRRILLHQMRRLQAQRHVAAAAGAALTPEKLIGDPANQSGDGPGAIIAVGIPGFCRRPFERLKTLGEAFLAHGANGWRRKQTSEGGKLAEQCAQQKRQ